MKAPDWYGMILLALAAYRVFRLLSEDTILDGPRNWVLKLGKWKEGQALPKGYRQRLADFLICPWCLGFWVTLAWWGAWQVWHGGTLVAAVPFALSTLVGAIAHALNEE